MFQESVSYKLIHKHFIINVHDWWVYFLLQIPQNIPMNYQIQMKQVLQVKNLKPAVVKVYDYYQTSKILCQCWKFLSCEILIVYSDWFHVNVPLLYEC